MQATDCCIERRRNTRSNGAAESGPKPIGDLERFGKIVSNKITEAKRRGRPLTFFAKCCGLSPLRRHFVTFVQDYPSNNCGMVQFELSSRKRERIIAPELGGGRGEFCARVCPVTIWPLNEQRFSNKKLGEFLVCCNLN